jgi:hypothetical protein
MKGKGPMMVIAIGVGGKKHEGMEEMDDMMESEDMEDSEDMEEPEEMANGGYTASKGRDGCAIKGKTKGRMV